MAINISPAVDINEIDLTLGVPAVATSIGAFAGPFVWGPVDEIQLLSSEKELETRFGKPNNDVAQHWFSAANFLSYSTALKAVRVVGAAARNGTDDGVGAIVKNEDDYQRQVGTLAFDFIAKYPGTLGNGIEVHITDEDGFPNWIYRGAFDSAPSNAGNEIHVAVVDGSGDWTGVPNTILETFPYVSTVEGTQAADGTNLYFKEQLNRGSQYVWVGDEADASVAAALAASNETIDGLNPNSGTQELVAVLTNDTEVVLTGTVTLDPTKRYIVVFDEGADGAAPFVSFPESWYTLDIANNKVKLTTEAFTGTGFDADGNVIVIESVTDATLVTETFDENDSLTVQFVQDAQAKTWEETSVVTTGTPVTIGDSTLYLALETMSATDTITLVRTNGVSVVTLEEGVDYTRNPIVQGQEGNSITLVTPVALGDVFDLTIASKTTTLVEGTDYTRTVPDTIVLTETAFQGEALRGGTYPTEGQMEVAVGGQYAGIMSGAVDANTTANILDGYAKFQDAETVDISLVVTGPATQVQAEWILENVAENRLDCVAFISPEQADVVNNAGNELDDCVDFMNQFNSSSYGFADNNWKYQYDRYNDVFRWVPCNGDTAGLAARTDDVADPWYSIAGFNRGQIKNVTKLAWNPNKAQRDELYKARMNAIVDFPGDGTILYGDKTMLSRPSAFDRINVRRLFIVLEKTIATAAKFLLFEFNDEFTRAQFRNLVEPFLRDVQGRRGITAFKVVADETNNTGEVIDRNEFVGDIFIKPARSINYITLNFIAVRTDVSFEEIGA